MYTKYTSLMEDWEKSGTDLKQFRALVEEMARATSCKCIKTAGLRIYSLAQESVMVKGNEAYRVYVLGNDSGERLMGLITGDSKGFRYGFIQKDKCNQVLADRCFKEVGFLLADESKIPFYVADEAIHSIGIRLGLTGGLLLKPSLERDLLLQKGFNEADKSVKLMYRSLPNPSTGNVDTKLFYMASDKYLPIPLTIIPDVIDMITQDAALGKTECRYWHVTQTFAEAYLEFPDAASDFQEIGKAHGREISSEIIPGLYLCSSDTGDSSVIVRSTFREGRSKYYVVENEYQKVHIGAKRGQTDIKSATVADMMAAIDTKMFAQVRKLPDALAKKIAIDIGDSDLSTTDGQAANYDAIAAAIEHGMEALKLQDILGKRRASQLVALMAAEFDPAIRCTEYDIAMSFLTLSDRIMQTDYLDENRMVLIAKACANAPYIDYAAHIPKSDPLDDEEDDEEIILLPA